MVTIGVYKERLHRLKPMLQTENPNVKIQMTNEKRFKSQLKIIRDNSLFRWTSFRLAGVESVQILFIRKIRMPALPNLLITNLQ